MSEELKALLRAQAVEIAVEGYLSWGNTMVCAAAAIDERDARIAEMQERFDSSAHRTSLIGRLEIENAQLSAELAAIKAQVPVGFAITDNDTVKLLPHAAFFMNRAKAEKLAALTGGCSVAPLYAAPVSEAKAQGVVMPERWNVPRPMWKDARQPYGNPLNHADIEAAEKFNLALDEVARLNAAPVQQVSVPDVSAMARTLADRSADACNVNREDNWAIHGQDYIDDVTAMLAAAPAAPAADAGLIEALELAANRLDRLALEHDEFWRGYATMWVREARAALSAHRTQGAV